MQKYLILFFIFFSNICFSQDTSAVDSLNVNDFENDSIVAYKKSRDFGYIKYMDSLLKKTKGLAVDTFSMGGDVKPKKQSGRSSSIANNFFNQPVVTIILWLLAVFFISLILYRLFLSGGFFKKEQRRKDSGRDEKEEQISDPASYERLIAKAVAEQNYRLAIRYLYLQTLHVLSSRGIIQFSPDKTNYEYVRELSGKPYQDQFSGITLSYEYVWYGKFDIGKDIYQQLSGDYRSFQQKI